MFTKVKFKRVALVAISSIGFGILGGAPSSATAGFSKSIALSTSYLTIVNGADTMSSAGLFYVDITNDSTGTLRSGLQTGEETMTISVVEDPDGAAAQKAVSDVLIDAVIVDTSAAGVGRVKPYIPTATESAALGALGTLETYTATTYTVPQVGRDTSNYESNNWTSISTTNQYEGSTNRYWFALTRAGTAATDAGYYKVRVRVQNSDSAQLESFIYVRWVSTIADAGAVLTLSVTGSAISGESLTMTTNQQWTATLRDPNGGRIQLGDSNADTPALMDRAPALDARLLTSTGTVIETLDTVKDEGTAGEDHVAPSSGNAALAAMRAELDGVYGITDAALGAFGQSLTNVLSVRVQNTAVSKTATLTTYGASSLDATLTTVALTADGIAAADKLATAVGSDNAISYSVPSTTTKATVTIDVGSTALAPIVSDVVWSGNYASASVTPASDTIATNYTDADGVISLTVTNSAPLVGAVATITLDGYDANAQNTITITWAKAVPTTISVVEPVSGIHQKLKGTTTFSVLVRDQFGAAVANSLLQPSLSSTSSNYSATTTYASIKTDASGIATWTLTDASAVADGTDAVSFASIDNASATAASYTITYKTTVATVGSFLSYYAYDFESQTAATVTTAVPSTGILNGAGGALTMVIARDLTTSFASYYQDRDTANAENDMIGFRVSARTSTGAAATGASVTVTAGTGGHVVSASGTPAASRTFAVPSTGDVFFQGLATAPGAITFTVTSGTVSTTITMNVAVPTQAAARTVAISGASTGVAFGDAVPMTVTVTDRYGNGVSGVNLTVTASGVGSFAGGATSQSFTTDSTGKYTFLASSSVEAGGSATFSASAGNAGDATSSAGYVGATDVDDTLAAGKSSASATVTFSAGTNPVSAAVDAAAEAIDAANAATDAANLAAEAADAATVAAEEARDAADAATAAVEELATQVATLMAALKAQITTLANTVAKIAKKVKA